MFKLLQRFLGIEKRALQVSDVSMRFYELMEEKIENEYEYPYILNHFIDNEGSYLIFTARGRLYKVRYTSDGVNVNFSDPLEVIIEFTEVSRSFKMHRNKNGKLCFYAVVAASVLNRVGQIDSTKLFDSFVDTFQPQPLNFYHIQDEKYRMGTIEGIAREKNLLLAWGYVDESTKLGRYAEKRFAKGDYGVSIEFYPQDGEMIEEDGIEIPVYTRGVFAGAAALLESDAASYLTNILSIRE